ARNAHASSVTVAIDSHHTVFAEACRLRIVVDDDGTGFAADASPGLGLIGMQERARALGGHVELCASPQGGLRVEALIRDQA
ncbi:MAG: hypothetical protein AAFX85_16525, partial [Pseudomonadota bacterium]